MAAAAEAAAPLTEQTFWRTRTQARGPRSFLFVVAELAELGVLARLANIPDARRLPRAELQTISNELPNTVTSSVCSGLTFHNHLCCPSVPKPSHAQSAPFKEVSAFYCQAWLQAISPAPFLFAGTPPCAAF